MMRPASLYSIQPDPYRNRRRSSTKDENNSPTTPKSTTQLIFKPEPGRTHSYLPYSNHAPDFKQSKAELYVEEDIYTLSSHHQTVDMMNGEQNSIQNHTLSIIDDASHTNKDNRAIPPPSSSDQINDLSLTDRLRYKRQKKQENTRFHTASSKRLFIALVTLLVLTFITLIFYFCWPRIPKFIIKKEKIERVGDPADWGPTQQPWFRAAWRLNLTLDNSANYVTTHISNIALTFMDRDTHVPFAWSSTGPIHLLPYKETLYPININVNYESQSVNDTTFKNLYNACGPQIPTESLALNVTMQAVVHITGIAWSTTLLVHPPVGDGLYCPFN